MNYGLFLPEFLLVGLVFLIFIADLFISPARKNLLGFVGVVGLFFIILSVSVLWGESASLYNDAFLVDSYALFFKLFFLLVAIVIILASLEFVKRHLSHAGEYYALILISTLAMMLMSAAGELITAYISVELLSFSLYVLASYAKENPKSNEAGIKYILLGAFSSALLLYGISLIYGYTQSTNFGEISLILQSGGLNLALLTGLVLIIAGLGFKIAAVPFHMWAPDVYEGAPLPITAYLSVASKAAGFALLLRLFIGAFSPALNDWRMILAVLAALSMTVGNLVALRQRNIKRLLAYSSISHVGFLLVGIAALSPMATSGIILYLVGYAASNLAAFICVIAYFNLTGKEEIPDYAGLAERAPFVALTLAAALFSLAGLPFFAGFTIKFYLFAAAAQEGLLWLVAIAVVNSLVSLYYYLLVIKQMYIHPPSEMARFRVPQLTTGVLGVLLFLVVLIGIYPEPLLRVIDMATAALFHI